MPCHHVDDALLQAYAAGHLDEPLALLVATHMALCPVCRGEVERAEIIGGALLENLAPETLNPGSLDSVLARLDLGEERGESMPAPKPSNEGDPSLPQPLRDYVGQRLTDLPWRGRGVVSEVQLLPNRADFTTRLLRIRAGEAVPVHTHEGAEVTMVLAGGFTDERGHYLRGDVAVAGREVVHRPQADRGEDCICLAITDAPLRLTGPVGRWLNFLFRF